MASPFFVPSPNYEPAFSGFADTLRRVNLKREEAEKERQSQQAKEQALEVYRSGDPDRIAEFNIKNPEVAKATNLWDLSRHKSEATRQNALESAYSFISDPSPQNLKSLVARRTQVLDREGVPPEDRQETEALMQMYAENPEKAIQNVKARLAATDTDNFLKWQEATGQKPGFAEKQIKVGAQSILEDGTIIQSTQQGPVVYNKFGERVKGEEAAQAVAMARAAEISNARLKEGSRRAAALMAEEELKPKVEAGVVSAKEAANASSAAFDRVEKIYQNIDNLREVVRLVEEEGAETGAIADRMPSFRSAAVKLDNLQGRLGLDVIGSTTFGALSEAELKFALSTALPQRLDGPALVSWAKQKIEAQEKLADYLEGAAIFLGTPGNTKADWIKKQKEMGGAYGRAAQRTPPPSAGVPGEQPAASARPVTEMSTEELMRIIQGGQ